MADLTEQTFGNYRLIRLLAKTEFSEVYVGEDIRLGRLAAVKLLRSREMMEPDLKQFLVEMRIFARLDHPNIVRIHDFGSDSRRG